MAGAVVEALARAGIRLGALGEVSRREEAGVGVGIGACFPQRKKEEQSTWRVQGSRSRCSG